MTSLHKCLYCGRDDFASRRGLQHHQQRNKACNQQLLRSLKSPPAMPAIAHNYMQMMMISKQKSVNHALSDTGIAGTVAKTNVGISKALPATSTNKRTFAEANDNMEDYQDVIYGDDESVVGAHFDEAVGAAATSSEEESEESEDDFGIDENMRKSFQEYVLKQQYALLFTNNEVAAIKLLSTLRGTKASLNTYENIMHWHLTTVGKIRSMQTNSDSSDFIPRHKLFTKLRQRYKYDGLYHQVTKITLPHSKAKAQIVWNDAKEVITSLLTDPRITDDDYLFFEDNPLASPPARLNFVEDLNTGRAYTRTYQKWITRPGEEVLLPVIFYIDAATTGQFADLPVTAVKLSLGIFSRKAREKDHFWRILGYIPAVLKHKSRGRRILLDSLHVDGVMAHQDALGDEGNVDDIDISKAQDFHTMLEVVLKSYIKLQNRGFYWDLPYKNRVYRNIEFVLFTPFIKVDGEEADKLCGKYLSRTRNVAQLCRYCECPTDKSDDPRADYRPKTKRHINALIAQNNVYALQQMSQHPIDNCMYALRFGSHNKQEIHGACPMEMLHALLLGLFKYTRDCFFQQIGETSKTADRINAYSKQYGELLSRQSDRDKPVTRFANGIKRGKLMAQEYLGILLCIAAVLRSTGGRAMLRRKKEHFGSEHALRDWSHLVETLLQWERWLKSESMEKQHVKEAKTKHRYIMYLMKKVMKRAKGMQLKLTKFHGVVHMAQDILNFGVPMEVDTGSNESGHKATKTAARLTQKNEETFDRQTAIRLEEVHLIEMAMLELEGKAMFNYGKHEAQATHKQPPAPINLPVGGAKLHVTYDNVTQQNVISLETRTPDDGDTHLETDLVNFVAELQDAVQDHLPSVPLRTLHKRQGLIFRGQNKYRGQVWRDWAMFDWGDEGELPTKIWGFVDLRGLPEDSRINFLELPLEQSVYAVVEKAFFDDDEDEIELSEIFVPMTKEVGQIRDNAVTQLKFYLADVDAIVKAIIVVPDIGGQPNAYFMVKDRETWRTDFMAFLERPLDLDEEITSEEEEDDDDDED